MGLGLAGGEIQRLGLAGGEIQRAAQSRPGLP